jgi:hypothetical protein
MLLSMRPISISRCSCCGKQLVFSTPPLKRSTRGMLSPLHRILGTGPKTQPNLNGGQCLACVMPHPSNRHTDTQTSFRMLSQTAFVPLHSRRHHPGACEWRRDCTGSTRCFPSKPDSELDQSSPICILSSESVVSATKLFVVVCFALHFTLWTV